MDLRLLVLGPVVREPESVAVFLDRLAQSRDVAVAEDAPDAGDEPVPAAVALDVLRRHESNDGLTNGEPDSPHRLSLRNRLQRRYHQASFHVNTRGGLT